MIELSGLSHVVDDPEGQILQPLLASTCWRRLAVDRADR